MCCHQESASSFVSVEIKTAQFRKHLQHAHKASGVVLHSLLTNGSADASTAAFWFLGFCPALSALVAFRRVLTKQVVAMPQRPRPTSPASRWESDLAEFSDFVRSRQLDQRTISILTSAGHLPPIFARALERESSHGEELSSPSQVSDCSSAIILNSGHQIVVTYGGLTASQRGKGKGRASSRPRTQSQPSAH